MGGVTDGPTVIRHLKSIFPRNVKNGKVNLQTDHIIFRIITRLTPTIFLILAGLIFWQRMSNEHINCYAPPDQDAIRPQAVNQYCFITGTYTVLGSSHLKTHKKGFPYPGVGPHVSPSESDGKGIKYHLYFQWVPFILLIQAILLVVPKFCWKTILKDNLSRYCNRIVKDEGEEDDDQSSPDADRFFRNIKDHKFLYKGFLFCEVLCLVIVVGCIYLTDVLLEGNFSNLGVNWVKYLIGESDQSSVINPLDLVFPKMSKCEFKMFGPGGGIINYDILCVMTLNVIHEKAYVFQWFWLWGVVILQILNLFYIILLQCSKELRWRQIMSRVEVSFVDGGDSEGHSSNLKLDFKKFLVKLGYSDWFVLEGISRSIDSVDFTSFLQRLVYLERNCEKRGKKDKDHLYLEEKRRLCNGDDVDNHIGKERMISHNFRNMGHQYHPHQQQFFQSNGNNRNLPPLSALGQSSRAAENPYYTNPRGGNNPKSRQFEMNTVKENDTEAWIGNAYYRQQENIESVDETGLGEPAFMQPKRSNNGQTDNLINLTVDRE